LAAKQRGDLSNLLKSVEDGLNGVAWLDDSQVVELHAWKKVASQPRCSVAIDRHEDNGLFE
jgi:Holliday junction resolvase RusA-like endonuclease